MTLRSLRTGGRNPPGRQDTKGARRMPRRRKPMKGAASCDKPRGGANGLRSGDSRMGEPSRGHALLPAGEHIAREEATGGTETSKYPEEEKSTEIARVAASESAPAQTRARVTARRRCGAGVAGPHDPALRSRGAVRKGQSSGTAWEGRRNRVKAPYAKDSPPRDAGPE